MRLSEFFTLREMTATQVRGTDNTPGGPEIDNMRRLCADVLDPIRRVLGPLHTNSGFRSVAVNAQIGGSRHSAHVAGCAWDGIPLRPDVSLIDLFNEAMKQDVDQVIFEFGRWIHVGTRPKPAENRHQALMIFEPGKYLPFRLDAASQALNREERSNG